ncbi:MAG: nucleotidyltransferase domain-containing protein [Anaerolineae bacterium]|nr:nucleotidyltransferase domain-containing protein [Anaerolineae bacterium]MDW8097896.1 nucleotidyltransferase domain-containing protein [Anaerolineae bacterium]
MTEVTPEQMIIYREGARRRRLRERQKLARRQERALALARRAAALLREDFGAKRVVLFGSLVRGGVFDLRSDVDLAVWGLDERKYLRALARLLDLDPTIEIDLVIAENASPTFLATIEQEGIPL